MPGEKARVTKEMVESIQNSAAEKTAILNAKIQDEFKSKMDAYALEKEKKYEKKVSDYTKKYEDTLTRQTKDINWEIHSQILKEKEKLWLQFENDIYQTIQTYTQTKEYEEAMMALQNQYTHAKFLIRKEDEAIFKKVPYEVIELELGGCYVEVNNSVRDYTLISKYKQVLEDFKASSRIEGAK